MSNIEIEDDFLEGKSVVLRCAHPGCNASWKKPTSELDTVEFIGPRLEVAAIVAAEQDGWRWHSGRQAPYCPDHAAGVPSR